MSESEEEESCYYGTPLEPYDEDAFPKKKPIAIEEQVAKDAQGRRRFHGAFTGGFSAGFYNTVGSLEGWTPTEFRSSRTDKATSNIQRPEDYMDDEDVGEFGIAPQAVKATDEYSNTKKRKKQIHSDGPIPGIPVLESLIEAGNETVGYFLMKNMNRRRHQQTNTGVKVYGCAMPTSNISDDEPVIEYDLHECYKCYLKTPKSNTSGLGYTSLDKTHLSLFQPAKLVVRERNNKKISISGQAFGVGAFEDEDDDIYVKDDMTHYDFELTSETSTKTQKTKELLLFDLFVVSTKNTLFANKISFPPPVIPCTFTGKYKVKKSRFEPLPSDERHVAAATPLNAAVRAKYLGETYIAAATEPAVKEVKAEAQVKNELLENILVDRFVAAKQSDDTTNILAPVEKFESDHGTEEMRSAVKMKMFGPLTRVTLTWQPCAFLCRRFNVPEPRFENLNAEKQKRTKNLIFEYQKHEDNAMQRKPGLETFSQNELTIAVKSENVTQIEMATVATTSNTNETSVTDTKTNKTSVGDDNDDGTTCLHISLKTDLFKAVFLSSSESEESDGNEELDEQTKKQELITANVVSEPLVPKIKPAKEGILSNINFPKVLQTEKPLISTNTYGPSLPNNRLQSVTATVSNEPIINIDEWVEKDEFMKEKKHKKKHKKEKKKHKHKSKR